MFSVFVKFLLLLGSTATREETVPKGSRRRSALRRTSLLPAVVLFSWWPQKITSHLGEAWNKIENNIETYWNKSAVSCDWTSLVVIRCQGPYSFSRGSTMRLSPRGWRALSCPCFRFVFLLKSQPTHRQDCPISTVHITMLPHVAAYKVGRLTVTHIWLNHWDRRANRPM